MKKTVSTKLSGEELAQLDAARGAESVAEFVRGAVLARIAGERREAGEVARTLAQIVAGLERVEARQAQSASTHKLLTAFVMTTTKNAELIRQNHPGLLPE